MAEIVGVFNTAHSPFAYRAPEDWAAARATRLLRGDVPEDDLAGNQAKAKRINTGFKVLRDRLSAARPDVIVIFGDDQSECFDFSNFPSFAVYVGETWEGHSPAQNTPAHQRAKLRGHPELAVSLLTGLMKRGFDPAFCMDMPKPERGIGHAFVNPATSLTDYSIPIIPILLNCYFAPQPTAMRCYQFGKAIGEIIKEHSSDLRVALVGSGGLWHTPGAKNAYLDEEFDRAMLSHLAVGDVRAMAEYFDNYCVPEGDLSQPLGERTRGSTGMPGPGGPQAGTRETCNWIAASAAADGQAFTIVDYVPLYASPIGAAFAYSLDISPLADTSAISGAAAREEE